MTREVGYRPFWLRTPGIPPLPRVRTAAAVLVGLWGFAVVDPILGIVGAQPGFLVVHDAARWRVALWLVALCLLPPFVLLGALVAARALNGLVASAALVCLSAVLVAAAIVPRLDDVMILPPALFIGCVAVTVATVGAAYSAHAAVRRVLAATWFSPAVFVAIFALLSPASDLVGPAGAAEAPVVSRPSSLIVVVLDELPLAALLDDELRIDPTRYPGFARLAALSTLYRNATTTSVWTERAVPSLLTGIDRREPGNEALSGYSLPRNLFGLVAGSHELHVAEQVARLCVFPECNQIARRDASDLYRDTALLGLRAWAPELWADERLRFMDAGWDFVSDESHHAGRLDTLIRRAGDVGTGPSLWYVHSFLPHRPYGLLPDGRRYPGGWDEPVGAQAGESSHRWHPDQRVADLMRQRLVLQIQAVDRSIQRLASQLESGEIGPDTMVVVTSDHGISFDSRLHARGAGLRRSQIADVAVVPLFVRYPGQTHGRVDDRPAQLIDLLPTVADTMGARLAPRWPVEGRSLVDSSAPSQRRRYLTDGRKRTELPSKIPLHQAVLRYSDLVPGGVPRSDVYAYGPLGSFVGMKWGELTLGGPPMQAALFEPRRFEEVKTEGPVPALVQATFDSNPDAAWAAVSVNGTIAGSGPVYRHAGRFWLAAMVDPRHFRAGANRIEIAIGDGSGKPLRPTRLITA